MKKVYFIICIEGGKWDKVLTRENKESALDTYSKALATYGNLQKNDFVGIMSMEVENYNDARDEGYSSADIAHQFGSVEDIVTLSRSNI